MRLDRIKIVTELTKQDMTKTELAKRSGYSRAVISSVCNGKSCLDRTAEAIATALGVTVEDLKQEVQ